VTQCNNAVGYKSFGGPRFFYLQGEVIGLGLDIDVGQGIYDRVEPPSGQYEAG